MAGVEILARKCANLIALERRSEAEEILKVIDGIDISNY
jgi:hypothetical protein